MPIDMKILSRQIDPRETVLLLGAGSSMPSGGLSGAQLAARIAEQFRLDYEPTLSLSDVAIIVEKTYSRAELVHFLRAIVNKFSPTGSLLNLPLYDWKSIFTTNYDTLVEQVYTRKRKTVNVYRSNFDFDLREQYDITQLYKLHGTIDEDISDGKNSRIIISTKDYDLASGYRELLFDTLRLEISTSHLLIIGHSLSDPDLKIVVDEALRRKRDAGARGKIFLLSYAQDQNRAIIFEERGISVCFGSLDDLFSELSGKLPPAQLVLSISEDPLDSAPVLRPSTLDVSHAITCGHSDVLKMYNGRAATYADIARGWTFEREWA